MVGSGSSSRLHKRARMHPKYTKYAEIEHGFTYHKVNKNEKITEFISLDRELLYSFSDLDTYVSSHMFKLCIVYFFLFVLHTLHERILKIERTFMKPSNLIFELIFLRYFLFVLKRNICAPAGGLFPKNFAPPRGRRQDPPARVNKVGLCPGGFCLWGVGALSSSSSGVAVVVGRKCLFKCSMWKW